MTEKDRKWLTGFINFCISEFCYMVQAGANLSDLKAECNGLIFNERDDLYTPRKHRIEVFYNFEGTPYKVCEWVQFGDIPNYKQRENIVEQIRSYTI